MKPIDLQVRVDLNRLVRTGIPEVVYGQGKTLDQVVEALGRLFTGHGFALATRLQGPHLEAIGRIFPEATKSYIARSASLGSLPRSSKRIAVLSAGTSDIPVAEEACFAAQAFGHTVDRFFDVGVAGLQRLLDVLDEVRSCDVTIVIAGMDGALPSVVGGLLATPVVAVPTSVGYGAGLGGIGALLSMLSSCSPGVGVVNIDNGFGAAALAHKILAASK